MDELIFESPELKTPTHVSDDGRFLLFLQRPEGHSSDIWALPLTGEKKPVRVVQTRYDEGGGSLSPDGKWIAYHSNDLGTRQVYVASFPSGAQRTRVSTSSGAGSVWGRDQKSIYYLSDEGQVMAADVMVALGQLRVAAARELFVPEGVLTGPRFLGFDEARKRFLLMTIPDTPEGGGARTIRVHTNWPAIAGGAEKR